VAAAVWRVTRVPGAIVLGLTAALAAPGSADAQSLNLSGVLRDVGVYVERYLSRVQSIVGVEKVTVQPVARDLSSSGFARTLLYELRLDWTPGVPATVVRELVKVNGRVPGPHDEPMCLDTAAITPEPLEFLLPENLERFEFTDSGRATVDGRRVRVLSYRTRTAEPAQATWKDGCGSFEPGRTRGRVWVDAVSAEVRRIESGLIGQVDVRVPREQPWSAGSRDVTFERVDTSIQYRAVHFESPDETVLMPATIESLTMVRNAASYRVRHEYSNYRRFETGARIVP